MTDATAVSGPRTSLIQKALWQSRVLITIAIVFTAAAYAIAKLYDAPFQSGTISHLGLAATVLGPAFMLFMVVHRFFYMALFIRPKSPTRQFIADVRTYCLDPDRLITAAVTFLATMTIVGSFVFLKDFIPVIHPFSWDPAFAAWDKALHGGQHAYELTLPLLATPLATTILNAAYHFWFFLLFFVVYLVCLDKDNPVRRNTFLISFALTWIIGGSVLATVFSSVGPVYYSAFGYGDDYEPLLALLRANNEVLPVWALGVHDMLLNGYLTGEGSKGISAMPSMHVTTAVLLAFYGFAWRRWAGWLLVIFAIMIQLGSVHLAWHYAIDGYFGAVIAAGCWFGAKWLAHRFS
ncbi:MAG: phosphatase PAP2 family protein [Pseudomonadota bacterium]